VLNWRLNSGVRIVLVVMLALGLTLLACGGGRGQEPTEPTESQDAVEETEEEPEAVEGEEAEEEEVVGPVESVSGCTDELAYVGDVSVPDGTVFGPNEPFIKTWRLQNAGDCDWSGYQIAFLDGEPMGTMAQDIPDMPAGEEFDISIEMTSPGGAGDYTGRWQIVSPEGYSLGAVTCVITVQEAEEPSEEEPEEEAPVAGAPNAPTNLTMPSWSMTTLTLAWEDNSDNEDGFRVRDGDRETLAEVGPDVTTVDIPAPACGVTYEIHVRAFNAAGRSEFSNTIEAEGFCQAGGPPAAPSGLTIAGWGMNSLTLSWVDNSDNEDGFRIRERDLGRLGEVGPNVTTYTIDFGGLDVEACETIRLRVRAYNAAGEADSEVFETNAPGQGCP